MQPEMQPHPEQEQYDADFRQLFGYFRICKDARHKWAHGDTRQQISHYGGKPQPLRDVAEQKGGRKPDG